MEEQENVGVALQYLAREKMKYALLLDLRVDLEICKLEGLDCKQYLYELKEIIDSFLIKSNSAK